jgi:hypothetical protein
MEDDMEFDKIPVPQGRHANNVASAIHLLCIAFFCFLLFYDSDMSAKINNALQEHFGHDVSNSVKYVYYGIIAFCLFSFGEAQLELYRISRVVELINGKRDPAKQFAQGEYGSSQVQFFVGMPTTINYSVSVDGTLTMTNSEDLNEFVNQEMRQEKLEGYELLIDNDAVILSKLFIIASQIRQDEARRIYDILDRARTWLLERQPKAQSKVSE